MRGLCRSRGFQYMDSGAVRCGAARLQDHSHKTDLPSIATDIYRVGRPAFCSPIMVSSVHQPRDI
jgi:hypothetical protein